MIVELATGTCLRLGIDAELYPEAVIFKCFYWYGNEFDVSVERATADRFAVTIRPRARVLSGDEIASLQSRVERDLIDFKTRDIVSRETRTIRELLVAKAFAAVDDLDTDPDKVALRPSSNGDD